MANKLPKRIPYFPGCSMATTAKENNQSLKAMCNSLGYKLMELKDWNCCGSSSAHSLNHDLAVDLAARNFSLVPKGKPFAGCVPKLPAPAAASPSSSVHQLRRPGSLRA